MEHMRVVFYKKIAPPSRLTTAFLLLGLSAASLASDAFEHFAAFPTSGPAPLTVKFCASAGIAIDFGDGTSSAMGKTQNGDCPGNVHSYTSHTYPIPGTYHLHGFPCPSHNSMCGAVAKKANMITIIVTSP